MIITDAWHPQVNGVVRTYEHLSEELRKKGHEVKVIGPANFPRSIPMPGYPEIRLAILPYYPLKRMIEEYQPDLIHLSTEGPIGCAGNKYCRKHGRRFSTSFHTQFPDYVAARWSKYLPFLYEPVHWLARGYVRRFHAPSSAMMVATHSLEEKLKSWGFKNYMHHVTRGANLDLFWPGEKTKMLDLPKPIALYVGRIAIEKSVEDFLEMDWQGSKVLIGDGPSKAMLEKHYPNAHFLGTKTGPELAEYYRSADVFVFPSRTDTFGIVIVEALASGIPVAAYNVTGPKDIVTEDYLGVLCEDNLGAASVKALQTPGTADKRADHVKSLHNWQHAGVQFEEALLTKVK